MTDYNREIWHERAQIIEAFASGKDIEYTNKDLKTWYPTTEPCFDFNKYEYRVRPEYRPYANLQEFCEAVAEKGSCIEVTDDCLGTCRLLRIANVNDFGITLQGEYKNIKFSDLHSGFHRSTFRWLDGTPCGKLTNPQSNDNDPT